MKRKSRKYYWKSVTVEAILSTAYAVPPVAQMQELGFVEAPSGGVWYHPTHWVVSRRKATYWAEGANGEFTHFKALTPAARRWAQDNPFIL